MVKVATSACSFYDGPFTLMQYMAKNIAPPGLTKRWQKVSHWVINQSLFSMSWGETFVTGLYDGYDMITGSFEKFLTQSSNGGATTIASLCGSLPRMCNGRDQSRYAPCQWDMSLHCNGGELVWPCSTASLRNNVDVLWYTCYIRI